MADVALDPLHPIQLGHVGIRHPFDDVILHVAERGALLVPQILEIPKSLHFAFPPEGYWSRKHDLSGEGKKPSGEGLANPRLGLDSDFRSILEIERYRPVRLHVCFIDSQPPRVLVPFVQDFGLLHEPLDECLELLPSESEFGLLGLESFELRVVLLEATAQLRVFPLELGLVPGDLGVY